jgi:glyoxylase-like metal-dependent hydrolase (beta-lactamase superfamily II)
MTVTSVPVSGTAVCESWFLTQRLQDDLYLITEPHYYWWNRANLWLIKGHDRDLLIDTGLGVASLRQHLAALLDKPLLAVASHIHFDHSGGMYEFEERAIHAAEAAALRQGNNYEALCLPEQGWVKAEHFAQLPHAGFTVESYGLRAAEPTRILEEGDVLDLGDRALEVLHLPGHSPGCIALYERHTQALFSGDVIYDGELLDELHCSDIPAYIHTYERLQSLPIETVYPGHYQIFGRERCGEIIADYLARRRLPGCPGEHRHLT